ncbi:MAG: ATP-grasp domain-containing protein [Abditibacteriota bacterium]|nr:ATP-grasp domain-containing protein [Abditibacteriota bacterium]
MKDITVLYTGCGAKYTPAFFDCLRQNGERNIRIVGTDISPDRTGASLVDVFYRVPAWKDPDYTDILLEICRKEGVDVLIPSMSGELPALADRRGDFERAGTAVSVSSRKSIELTANKLKLYEFLKQKGFPTPAFAPIRSAGELEEACGKCGYPENPVCVKAVDLSGSRGVRVIMPRVSRFDILFGEKPGSFVIAFDELLDILRERPSMPEMLAMEYLPGMEGSVDLLAEEGRVLYAAYRESTVNLHSIPQEAVVKDNPEALRTAERVMGLLEFSGNADLDFKEDAAGRPVLMEVNPRVAATMKIFMVAGLNLPYLRIKQLLGEELPEAKARPGVKMVRRYLELFDCPPGDQP